MAYLASAKLFGEPGNCSGSGIDLGIKTPEHAVSSLYFIHTSLFAANLPVYRCRSWTTLICPPDYWLEVPHGTSINVFPILHRIEFTDCVLVTLLYRRYGVV